VTAGDAGRARPVRADSAFVPAARRTEEPIEPDDEAAEVIDAWRERLARGDVVDPEDEVRARPHLAERLRAGFDALRSLGREYGHDPAAALVGRTLGAWRIESVLGSGGMGAVYLATDAKGARAAVKVIHPHLLERPGFFKRFLREAEIGRRVRHANVVRTLDADESVEGGARRRFLVMEYVEGRTLRSLLAESGKVPEALCRHIGREIAAALAAIHAAGAVHRDLKPENVLVTRDHVVKVMDLGVSRLADEAARLSQTGAFVGSLLYAAPEQFGGLAPRSATSAASSAKGVDAVDGRADLHALGLVLHELATGAHPFAHDDFRVVVRRIADEAPRRCGEVDPQIAPFFEEVVATLLAKKPEDRFASADELFRVLDEGEESAWWRERANAIRAATRRPMRRPRVPRETALYGRASEIARLRELFERTKAGDGQVVLVEGEAGIGKSRLVDEFVTSLAAAGEDVDFLFGSYPPGGAATASGAFSTAYRAHLGDDEAALREALPQTPLLVPAFTALLRGDVAPADAEKLTKDSLQTLFVHATRSFAARRTTIVFIDDLHFAPEEGRGLFASLALAVPGHRILLVGGARPSLDEKWAAGLARLPHVARLPIERLSPKDLVDLLADALGSRHLAEELGGKIAAKSDGNPFFVFEILRGLREGQFLTRSPTGTWITTRSIRDIDVPPSIVEVIQARVSDLGEADRNALEVASCIGFEFDAALVGAVLGVAPIPLLQRLGRIEKAHRLVRSVGHRFVFDHHQVQEVLYAGLSAPLSEAYHAAIGDALEARSGAAARAPEDVDGALCVDLAEHFLSGAKGERGLRYLDAAMTHLEKRWLNDAAVRLAARALAVPGLLAGTARMATLLRLADRLDLLGRRDPQRATVEEALVVARATGDRAGEVKATVGLGSVFWSLGRYAEARECVERQLALAQEIGDRRGEATATGNLGNVFYWLDRYADARQQHERHLALSREIGDRRGEARATGNLGNVFHALDLYAEARRHYERHFALAREIGDRWVEAIALVNLGRVLVAVGDARSAAEALRASLALCRMIGTRRTEGYALHCLAVVGDAEGDLAAAVRLLDESLALRREIGHGDGVAESLLELGDLRRRSGDADAARAALEESVALSREQGRKAETALGLALLACLTGGDPKAALAALADVRESGECVRRIRLLLWQATGDDAHLVEAKRRLDFLVEHAPPECRESMLANVRLHREIVAAWREHGASDGGRATA
jgi:serine/threonine protein kinase/tetratricopeptide (TPR) repeat protein